MAIRIDENTIFEDGRIKKISEAKAETKVEAETEEEPKTVEAETEEEPKTKEAETEEEPKTKAGRKPKAPIKGKEA